VHAAVLLEQVVPAGQDDVGVDVVDARQQQVVRVDLKRFCESVPDIISGNDGNILKQS
jgi:hypothetical protein